MGIYTSCLATFDIISIVTRNAISLPSTAQEIANIRLYSFVDNIAILRRLKPNRPTYQRLGLMSVGEELCIQVPIVS